jgi:hypothetical protein
LPRAALVFCQALGAQPPSYILNRLFGNEPRCLFSRQAVRRRYVGVGLNVQRRHHDFRQLAPKIRGGERADAVAMLAIWRCWTLIRQKPIWDLEHIPLPQEIGAGADLVEMSAPSRAPDRT